MQTVKPYGIGSPMGITVVMVRSIEPESTYKHGGKNYGYRYEYGINLYCFEREEEYQIKERLGLTDEEYNYWLERLRTEERK